MELTHSDFRGGDPNSPGELAKNLEAAFTSILWAERENKKPLSKEVVEERERVLKDEKSPSRRDMLEDEWNWGDQETDMQRTEKGVDHFSDEWREIKEAGRAAEVVRVLIKNGKRKILKELGKSIASIPELNDNDQKALDALLGQKKD